MPEWNKEQKQVIESRKGNILVSAAAGSGKTAVLIERIMEMIMDEKSPCDVDEFLVVTFTNAAAQQLREKITEKLDAAVKKNPGNQHLVKQLSLIRKADITTIDSFCLKVVKENFNIINIDPSFNIVDDKLVELTKNDLLDEMFEEKYEAAFQTDNSEKYTQFTQFSEAFGNTIKDDELKKIILNVFRKSSSYPYPDEWLENAKKAVDIKNSEELNASVWMKAYLNDVKHLAMSYKEIAETALKYCTCENGCKNNTEVALKDIEIFDLVISAESYDEVRKILADGIPHIRPIRKEGPEKENYLKFKELRDIYKDELNKIAKNFNKSTELIIYELENIRVWIHEIVDLCLEFEKRLSKEKTKSRQYEFSDIEHMALKILTDGHDENGRIIPSDTAKSIAASYKQIYIDEYQDSNFLQEEILNAVSGYREGENNIFMVGDVKQSIYRFRMARPDLFMEKYSNYTLSENDGPSERRIDLMKNYRSRYEVLSSVNYIFSMIMKKDFGGIEYDEAAFLNYGELYPKTLPEDDKSKESPYMTEFLLASPYDEEEETNDEDEEELEKLEYEALMIAQRIKELTDEKTGLKLWDSENDCYRKTEYKDIVILLRSLKNRGDVFARVLEKQNIPVFLDNPNGYFDAAEVSIILAMLKVVDNIRQDIPLAAVLTSPMAEISNSELAVITGYSIKNNIVCNTLYDRCEAFMEKSSDEPKLKEKLKRIFNIIFELKEKKTYMSISQLIKQILKYTDYDIYAYSMPMGEKRIANINMLMEKADSYENGNYKGLFNFLRYMEKLRVHDIDFGEASTVSDTDNVVRITTMHKSKGLEYPVAFVSCLGQQFNSSYTKEDPVIHTDYYMASKYINLATRRKNKTFMRDVLIRLTKIDNLAEEQRVLYVAMTRAKEKLILTGCVGKKKPAEGISYGTRSNAVTFLDWVYPCVLSQKESEKYIDLKMISRNEIISGYIKGETKKAEVYTDTEVILKNFNTEERYRELKKEYEYIYPYLSTTICPVKVSVSEIKKAYMAEEDYENGESIIESEREIPLLRITKDEDVKEHTALSGAERGTIIHRLMELLDYSRINTKDDMKLEINNLLNSGAFSEEERHIWGMKHVYDFFDSPLFNRMKDAYLNGLLRREKQFIIGLPANKIYKDNVLMQGIIDAYIEDSDGIVLIDYKTDKKDEEALVKMYQTQLELYSITLEQLTGLKVKEKILYSFYLDKEIRLN